MIDRSIPHIPVLMIKTDTDTYPECAVPEGYSLAFYRPDTGREEWNHVQYAARQIEDIERIDKVFADEFLTRPQALPGRMLFARDEKGEAVATATLWPGSLFGRDMPRIHWVATDEAHQGKGLCRALLSRLMRLYREIGDQNGIYLVSQTNSYAAIRIYESFGFKRYLGEEPQGFHVDNFQESAKIAWNLIDGKLREHGFTKRHE